MVLFESWSIMQLVKMHTALEEDDDPFFCFFKQRVGLLIGKEFLW